MENLKIGSKVKIGNRWGTVVNKDNEGVTVRYPNLDETWSAIHRIQEIG